MKLTSLFLAASLSLALVPAASAQQLEVNDAGGALKILSGTTFPGTESDPVVGSPVQLLAPAGQPARLRIAGAPSTPFIFILGQLATTSLAVAAGNPATEYFDLDLGGFLYVIADGIGGGGQPFFNHLSAAGHADYTFTTHAGMVGASIAFQAVTIDATSPFGLNFTAAAAFDLTNLAPPASISADDGTIQYTPGTPLCFAGGVWGGIEASTNGFVRFDHLGGSDLSESAADFVSGAMGAAAAGTPGIAMVWDDLHCAYTATSSLTVMEIATGVVQVQWNDFSYFANSGHNNGTMVLTIDVSAGSTLLTMDYSMTTLGVTSGTLNRGLVGVTSGNGAATVAVGDLVVGGIVSNLGGAPGLNTIYEDFNSTGPIDVSGVVINVVDGACDGTFITF